MNAREEILELIDLYLADALSASDRQAFELRMAQDSDFKELVEDQKLANELVLGDRLFSLKSMMDEDFSSGKVIETKYSDKNGRLYFFIGLAFIITGLSTYLVIDKFNTEQPVETITSNKVEKTEAPAKEEFMKESLNEVSRNISKQPDKALNKENPFVKEDAISIPVSPDTLRNITSRNDVSTEVNEQVAKSKDAKAELKCIGKVMSAEIEAVPSCAQKEDGRVVIGKVSFLDIKKPLEYGLSGSEGDTLWQNSKIFTNLPSGKYSLVVKDANACRLALTNPVIISTKQCSEPEQTQSFNPSYGETFTIKVENPAVINIKNKSGVLVYTASITPGEEFNWDGTSILGGISAPGLYIYSLEYKSEKTVTGKIIIY